MKKVLILLLVASGFRGLSQDTVRLSLLFTGDIMQHDSQIAAAFDPLTGQYDYRPCFEFVKPVLSAPGLTFGNLELTLAGPPYKGYPQFSAPDALLVALKDAGFDVLVTANNHCVDRGSQGLERTIDLLDSAAMLHTGTFRDTLDWLNNHPLLIRSQGFTLSLLNYTYGTNGMPVYAPNKVNRIDTVSLAVDLKKAAEQHPDMVIVFLHWGQEYQSTPNAWQSMLADFCFRHGAGMVIGSHPHVIQPVDWQRGKNRLVAYSLGNFVSGQRDRYRNGGMMLQVTLEKSGGAGAARIQDVQYELAYVDRAHDARRTYRILPVNMFANDSSRMIGKAARESLIQFRDDAQMLLGQPGKNIIESPAVGPASNHQ